MMEPASPSHRPMSEAARRIGMAFTLAVSSLAWVPRLDGGDGLDWSGFAIVRGATQADTPFDGDAAQAQAQVGLDWSPSASFLAHVHLLARTDDGQSQRG